MAAARLAQVVDSVVGQERLSKLDIIIAGDDVSKKKPDPEIYNTAAERLGLPNTACVVVEDSIVGLRAAKSAGMKCVITYTEQTVEEDFYGFGADAKMLDFSSGVEVSLCSPHQNGPDSSLSSAALFHPLTRQASALFKDGSVLPDLLPDLRDPKA